MKQLKHFLRRQRDRLPLSTLGKLEEIPAEPDQVHITNQTVAARREEVLGSARKYIYPLQASKNRIVKWSVSILLVAVVGFFGFCALELYKFHSSSSFIYGVVRVLPFPVAIIDHKYLISYDDYLFDLRHYLHYYQTQQGVNFATKNGRQQLAVFERRALDETIQSAYVQRLASAHHISVSNHDVDEAVALVRTQNRLGASDQVFASVLNEFWGWSVDDFRRELRQELLAQQVVDTLDTTTHDRANQALASLQHGSDFAKLAQKVSDDASTRGKGGDYGALLSQSSANLPPQVVQAVFQLKTGQYSGVINTGYSLEIVKLLSVQGNQRRAAHMAFNFKPVTAYTTPLQTQEKVHVFIHF